MWYVFASVRICKSVYYKVGRLNKVPRPPHIMYLPRIIFFFFFLKRARDLNLNNTIAMDKFCILAELASV